MHEIVQRAMVEDARATAVYNEVAVDIPALSITGHCDTLLQFSDDEYELLEFKSISPKGMNYGDLPKKEHVSQARTYAYGLRHVGGVAHVDYCDRPDGAICTYKNDTFPVPVCTAIPPLGDKLQRIRIAYFNRDDLEIREFVLPVDEEWERDLEAKIARLNRYLADAREDDFAVLPPRLPLERGKKNWLCQSFCQFRTRCWNLDTEGEDL